MWCRTPSCALRGINNFSKGNDRAWVLTIVRHTAYTWMHKNRPTPLVLVEDVEGIEGAESREWDVETPETALTAKADAAGLQSAIAALPTPYRETMILRDVQGLSYREIAEAGVPIGTVMSRLARARRRLIATMTKDEARACPLRSPLDSWSRRQRPDQIDVDASDALTASRRSRDVPATSSRHAYCAIPQSERGKKTYSPGGERRPANT
jgi:RNA polymerase sigma factor (sigma-70 family)